MTRTPSAAAPDHRVWRAATCGLAAVMLATAPTAHAMAQSAAAARADARVTVFRSPSDGLAWISRYHDDPRPEAVPDAIKALAKTGAFRDPERAGVYLGFYAGVLGANQLKARELIASTFPMPPEDQIVVVRGIADSGLPEWRDLLGAAAERMPARMIAIREYLDGTKKPLQDTSLLDSPAVIDAWWGIYFATGAYHPVRRIIPALAWSNEDADLDKLTIGSIAKWTLAANASRDKPLLDFLRAEAGRVDKKAIAKELAEVVRAAERFEVTALRKAQLSKVETLKAKGPPKGRTWSWWTHAANTALALGCVVAGATGAGAVIGLPCVIGGAVATAATNFLRLEEHRKRQ